MLDIKKGKYEDTAYTIGEREKKKGGGKEKGRVKSEGKEEKRREKERKKEWRDKELQLLTDGMVIDDNLERERERRWCRKR